MSERDFERYLAVVTRLLRRSSKPRAIAAELRAHLEDRLQELRDEGVPHQQAVDQALAEFGDAADLADSFVQISRGKQRRWIMRAMTFSVAASLLVAAALWTFWPGRNAAPGTATAFAQAAPEAAVPLTPVQNSKADDALNRRVDIDFKDVPLKDVAQYLSELTGVTFYLMRAHLSEAGIGEDQPLTSKFHDIRLKTWLELALEELELRYLVRDDVVLITSPEYAESKLEVRVYDCRDLLAMPAPLGAEKLLPARPAAGAAMRGGMFSVADDPPGPGVRLSAGGGGFGGLGSSDNSAADPGPRTEHDLRVERLIELITGNIDADSWTDVGGPGSIHEYNGLIVVTQTGQTHDKVERVLDMLRAAADLDGPGKVVR